MITKSGETLYHGSSNRLKVLSPKNEHGDTSKQDLVFLSPRREFALGYAGAKWTDANLNQGYRDGKPYFLELKKGIFDKTFNRSGYLHHVNADSIEDSLTDASRGSSFEVGSSKEVIPDKIEKIKNVLNALQESGVTMHAYNPNSKEYMSAVVRMAKRVDNLGHGYASYIEENNPELYAEIMRHRK